MHEFKIFTTKTQIFSRQIPWKQKLFMLATDGNEARRLKT